MDIKDYVIIKKEDLYEIAKAVTLLNIIYDILADETKNISDINQYSDDIIYELTKAELSNYDIKEIIDKRNYD